VVREVAGYLGNTPAVARASYIDPRVIRHYENGPTVAAVLGDLGRDRDFGDLATRGMISQRKQDKANGDSGEPWRSGYWQVLPRRPGGALAWGCG
jgi:hypothetical protein